MQPSADIGPQTGSTAGRLAMVALTTLMLLWPVAFNGGVILYPDTFAYVDNGADAVYGLRDLLFGNPDTAAPANAPWQAVGGRSPFYGLLGFFSWRLGGFAVASFVQRQR
jgi:hypothetical protein